MPRPPNTVVERPRLDALLAEGRRHHLTLISAPPGAGKTTLLARWAGRADAPVAWLTLDPGDNVVAAFTRSVLTSLCSAGVLPAVDAADGDETASVDDIIGDLSRSGVRAALVLDDVHHLTSRMALDSLRCLVERAPRELDLIIASRADPALPLGRLRLEGRLGEIRNESLLFTVAEAADLFTLAGLRLSQRDVTAIHLRAEGWAAGLRLIAHALEQGARPERFALDAGAAEAAVSDYLLTEVLEHEDPCVRRFLERTSIVDDLTPELAVTLCEDPRAGSRLAELERRGLFVTDIDGRGTYRYHALFSALLRSRLRHDEPGLHHALHRQAARWYAERGVLDVAEQHARRAEDWALLGSLVLSRWLDATLDGREAPADLIGGLPDEAVRASAALSLVAAAAALASSDREGAVTYRSLHSDCGSEVASTVFDLLHARSFGRSPGGSPRRVSAGAFADERLTRFAALCRAELALEDADPTDASARLAELAEQTGWTSVRARALLALVHAIQGRLGAARTQAAAAREHLGPQNREDVDAITSLAVSLADAQDGLGATRTTGPGAASMRSSRSLDKVDQAVRAAIAAPSGHVSLDRTTAQHPLAERALIALGVLEVIDPTGRHVGIGGEVESAVRRARGALNVAASSSVRELLTPWSEVRSGATHPRTSVEAFVLLAAAAVAQGEHDEAVRNLHRALDEAATDGLWASFRTWTGAVWAPLETIARSDGPHQAAAMQLLDEAREMHAAPFVEPLTDQERAVLRLLSSLMSNVEIAEAMHLSVNTIKTHLKALYRKLGVKRRRDAVVRSRQLDLL